jgi:hypothetical protein
VNPGPNDVPALSASFGNKDWSFHYFNHDDDSHQLIVFHSLASGLTKVKLVQFSPVVTIQPTSQSASQGSSLTFSASAVGNPAPTVQWQFSTDGGTTWTNDFPPFGTSTTINTGPLFSFMNGWENRAIFTNSLGTAISDAATMTVTP